MPELDDVRRIALDLPETTERGSWGSLGWRVRDKLFVWERPLRRGDVEALGHDAPPGTVLGARTADVGVKQALIADDPHSFFTTPHFTGYPAVLVRLDRIAPPDLEELIVEAWLVRAPKRLVQAFLDSRG
ncbi:MAG: MmcQ/YjbR family DNA-binding protein [Jatrophihabitantaceae bacterium]